MNRLFLLILLCAQLNFAMETKEIAAREKEAAVKEFENKFYNGCGFTAYTTRVEELIKGHPMSKSLDLVEIAYAQIILKNLFDCQLIDFYRNHPTDETAQVIKRWVRAVSFKLLKYANSNPSAITEEKEKFKYALLAFPMDWAELEYVTKVKRTCLGKMNPVGCRESLMEDLREAINKKLKNK